MDYIWHCPGKDCRERGIILFKTQTPFLLDGQIKCPNCNNIYSFIEIEKYNKNNLKKYLKRLML